MIHWKKLFEDKERQFWLLHSGGWLGFALVFYLGSFLHDMRSIWLFVIILNAYAGWLLTIPLRYLFRRLWRLEPWAMILAALASSYVMAILWTVVKNLNYWELYKHGYRPDEWIYYFSNSVNSFSVIVCWSGLYFGIKYYRLMVQEKQNALNASTMAHQAHLRMLRYQLNPHFLFNTLNAISTLILIKDNQTANAMVSRLSDFLRYSLDKDPIKKVPLEQELQAIDLYLDIEKVRFEDRLTVTQDIAPDTREALVPSLILQPLIENAIKYAIAKLEAGGIISIKAKSFGQDLLLEVADNGPGAKIIDGQLSRSNGVGIPNIKERLTSLYGDNFSFVITDNKPSGVKVSIRIPFQVGQDASQD
ncbi:histidine kinase [Aliiglaciecola sp. CAU 1673]|uniref:sensor histidine kinase n=1 Tax=Aliiglaciecola sp. CAU 1673 TaxID=3032595 RepID=UPI0023DB7BDA|nr:histidine kinase [Aliiglaciecola sp. CAU 1673]MDF2177686.1 histidine kinase [Aliiglaciecola sp. CAU 1673]